LFPITPEPLDVELLPQVIEMHREFERKRDDAERARLMESIRIFQIEEYMDRSCELLLYEVNQMYCALALMLCPKDRRESARTLMCESGFLSVFNGDLDLLRRYATLSGCMALDNRWNVA